MLGPSDAVEFLPRLVAGPTEAEEEDLSTLLTLPTDDELLAPFIDPTEAVLLLLTSILLGGRDEIEALLDNLCDFYFCWHLFG